MCVCVCIRYLLLEEKMNMDKLYINRNEIQLGRFIYIFQIQILTCACAVEFRGFLEKYSKYRICLSGFERKLVIAYQIVLIFFTSFSVHSHIRACADHAFSESRENLLYQPRDVDIRYLD